MLNIMYFILDNSKKIIFGWTPKCGCSHFKRIIWFLINGNEDNEFHTNRDYNNLPDDIENYTVIIIGRNPYKRVVSGFLDKYRDNENTMNYYKKRWNCETIEFSTFINELIKNNWEKVDSHHFLPQTSEKFDICVNKSNLIVYDIENIDYHYIEKLYNTKIPDTLLKYKGNHSRDIFIKFFEGSVYDLDMKLYANYNITLKQFYNEEIKNKVYEFYKNDFLFFKESGINYENTF